MKQGDPVLIRIKNNVNIVRKVKIGSEYIQCIAMGIWVKRGGKSFRTYLNRICVTFLSKFLFNTIIIINKFELCPSKRIRNIFGKFCFSQLLIAAYITGCEAWDWNFKTFKNLKHVTRSKNSVAFNCYFWLQLSAQKCFKLRKSGCTMHIQTFFCSYLV